MARTLWVPALVALAMAVIAPGALAAKPKAADRALDRALERVVSVEDGPPGVIALVHRGSATKVHQAGIANVENERVWRPRDHMRLASVSKAFNGAVALSLVQRGRLELDDTIGEALPALRRAGRQSRWASCSSTRAAFPTTPPAPASRQRPAPTCDGDSRRSS